MNGFALKQERVLNHHTPTIHLAFATDALWLFSAAADEAERAITTQPHNYDVSFFLTYFYGFQIKLDSNFPDFFQTFKKRSHYLFPDVWQS